MALTYLATNSGYLGSHYYAAGQQVSVAGWSQGGLRRALLDGDITPSGSNNGGMVFSGAWAAGSYPPGSVVTLSGSVYLNISSTATTATPGTVNPDWKQLGA